ncbi:MAG TPA: hypothetical protein VFK44_15175 [Bacillales bacterium]|nr:hypothetical protein [Bacillales bacterium]
MAKFMKSRKWGTIGIPIAMLLILSALLLFRNLQLQQVLPSEGWSRSIQLPAIASGRDYPFLREADGKFEIYTRGKTELHRLVVDSELNVVNDSKLAVKIAADKPFWAGNHKVVYLKKDQLMLNDEGKNSVLASSVDGMQAAGDNLILWKGTKLYKVDVSSFQLNKIGETQHWIKHVVLDKEKDSFLVVSVPDGEHMQTVFFKKTGKNYKRFPLFTIPTSPNTSVAGFDFAVNGKEVKVSYSAYVAGAGGARRDNYLGSAVLQSPKPKTSVNLIRSIHDEETKAAIPEAAFSRISYVKGEPVILLTGRGILPTGVEADSVFRAVNENGQWTASRISSTNGPSENPFWLNDQTVLWFDFDDYERYRLEGASQDPEVISESLQLRSEDWANAFNHMLPTLTGSLLMFFYASFLWALPVGLFLVILMITSITMMERNPSWILYVSIALYLGMQLYFIQTLLTETFFRYAPEYLTFPGGIYIVPVILAAASWFILRAVGTEDWGVIARTSYFIGIDGLMLAFLMGPYMI